MVKQAIGKSNRNSNIELMRIIMMLMILIHHMITHGIFSVDTILCHVGPVNSTISFAIVLNSFCYIGVNGFILISGYFGINFKIRSLLNLYLICMFYSIVMHFFEIYGLGTKSFSIGTIKDVILVFSQQDYWWFIRCYVILYLMSPLLNKALNVFDQHEYVTILVLLTIANLYMGYWWGRYGDNGYSVAQFVYVYAIGRYIGIFVDKDWIVQKRMKALCVYISVMLLFSLLSICSHYIRIPHWKSFPYNNPLLLIGAIAFILFMLSFHFKSHFVNRIAMSSLSIYLLQNFEIMRKLTAWVQEFLHIDFYNEGNTYVLLYLILYLISFSLLFAFLSVLIDQVRIIFTSPFMRLYDRKTKQILV